MDTQSTVITTPLQEPITALHAERTRTQRAALKILITTPPDNRTGGVGQYFRSLRGQWTNEVCQFTVGSRSENEPRFSIAWRLVHDTWKFIRCLRRGRFDVVHLNPSLGSKAVIRDGILLLAAKALGNRVVVFIHGWDERFEQELILRHAGLTAAVLNRADAIIVLAREFETRLRKLGYQKTVFVAPAPVDSELMEDAARFANAPRPQRGSAFTILFLARLEKEKGIFEAIETFRILKAHYPQVRMIIGGDGPARTKAEKASRGLSGIEFAGHVQNEAKYRLFRVADAYLFPSHHEGLPLSVLEAMAYGLPIVTSRVGGLPDFFVVDKMGFMIDTRCPKDFASAVETLIVDPARASLIRSFNHDYAASHFNAQRIAAALEDVYSCVAAATDRRVLSPG